MITAVWALAFLVLVIADLILLYMPDWPHRVGILLTIAALYGAFKFTVWYPDRGQGLGGGAVVAICGQQHGCHAVATALDNMAIRRPLG